MYNSIHVVVEFSASTNLKFIKIYTSSENKIKKQKMKMTTANTKKTKEIYQVQPPNYPSYQRFSVLQCTSITHRREKWSGKCAQGTLHPLCRIATI